MSRSPTEIEALGGVSEKKEGVQVTTIPLPSTPHSNHSQEALTPQKDNKSLSYVDRVDRWWLYELAAWLIAVAAFLGIVFLLNARNDRPLPNWTITTRALGKTITTRLTINTVISIISTVLKSTIMIPIAASIAQLKWLWFHDGNKLSDLERFDAANRGPLGSIILLWQTRGRSLVCLGCLIVLLMLGLDFSLQAAVTYPLRPVKVANATIPAKHTYTEAALSAPSGNSGIQSLEPVRSLRTAMQLVAYDIDTAIEVTPSCSTGNCTWSDSFATLGVCNECHDATSILNISCALSTDNGTLEPTTQCNYSWPGTQDLIFWQWYNEIPADYWSMSDASASDGSNTAYKTEFASNADLTVWDNFNYFFRDFKQPVAVLSVLQPQWENGNLTSVIATQCALKACVKKFTANMTNNLFTEKLVDTFENKSATTSTGSAEIGNYETSDYMIRPNDSFFEGMNPATPRVFTLGINTMGSIAKSVSGLFTGDITVDPLQHPSSQATDSINHLSNLTQAGIFAMMDALAGNMTNAIRMSNVNTTTTNNLYALGEVLQDRTFVRVRWAWLALPIFELLLTLLFLLLTMKASTKHKDMLWKGSTLAPFYYPLTKEGRSKVSEAVSPRTMEGVASGLKVQWVNTDQGLRLVQR